VGKWADVAEMRQGEVTFLRFN